MGVNRYLGGVVSADPNTPTVTSASGTWTLEEAQQNIGNWPMAQSQIQNSLRFNSADSAYLSRTPSVAGNRKTWTISVWVKRSTLGGDGWVYDGGSTSNSSGFEFSDDKIRIQSTSSSGAVDDVDLKTTAVYRDPSAWYHVVLAVDTTQTTSTNRVKLYVNGSQVTSFSTTTYPSLNYEFGVNNTNSQKIGKWNISTGRDFNGYLTEFNLIDGLALSADYFGFTDANGIWQPKPYKGAYGTNGFYLPMTLSATATGFSTVTYEGNASTNKITGTGFAPDLVWIKDRSYPSGSDHFLFDALRTTYSLSSNTTGAETQKNNDGFTSLDPDGFTLNGSGGGDNINRTDSNMVAWCWDAGSSTVTNNDGTITSTIRASQANGFSVVTYTGTGSSATIGHGLGSTPSMIIVKNRSASPTAWRVYHSSLGLNGSYPNFLQLNTTAAVETGDSGNFTAAPSSTVFSVGNYNVVNGSGNNMVAYCFSEISGFSKFGSYTGNGSSTGPTVTLGFKPAFVLVKNASASWNWQIYDNVRDTVNPNSKILLPNSSNAEYDDATYTAVDFNNNGFQIKTNDASINGSGNTIIYMAFADTRAFDPFDDYSGNGNNWQPNNIGTDDVFTDVPTNQGTDTGVGGEVRGNYATWNPLDKDDGITSVTNGNLQVVTNGSNGSIKSTIAFPSGKWYWEVTSDSINSSGTQAIGIMPQSQPPTNNMSDSGKLGYAIDASFSDRKFENGTATSYGSYVQANGDIYMLAFDQDAGKLWYGVNGTWLASGDPAAGTNPSSSSISTSTAYCAAVSDNTVSGTFTANFGQKPFSYTAPSGYKALCTQNLSTPTILDGADYFNATLWTGNGATQTITTGIANDLVWTKDRGAAYDHTWFDVLRTPGYFLRSNSTSAEEYRADSLTAFTSTGFSVGADSVRQNINKSGNSYVSWVWKANGAGVSNTAGDIPSTVSANTTAGFSIITYTGNGSANQTVGHGLGVAPAFGILKDRDTNSNNNQWHVFATAVGDQYGYLSATNAFAATAEFYPTSGSSTTVTIGRSSPVANSNESGDRYVMYLFAPVAGYSAFGSYTGNGSSDGPFVFCGFRPRYVLVKNASATGDWFVYDTSRNTYNVADNRLKPNLSDAEGTGGSYGPDILSNGFKMRSNFSELNGSGNTIIYAAFAENPFKLSRAR